MAMAAKAVTLLAMMMPCLANEPSLVCEEITSCQECFRSGCFGWQLGQESCWESCLFCRNVGGSVGGRYEE